MGRTGTDGFKKLSRWLVIALAVVVALVSYNINIPAGRSSSHWKFVVSHPTILLHIVVATATLVLAIIMLVQAVRSRERSWIILSAAGLAFVALAFASGEDYVMTLQKSALNYMSIGWLGAIIGYGIGWYLGHRNARQERDAMMPGS
jgi:multisubunit Na+/H+ antiporter MnhB subunit